MPDLADPAAVERLLRRLDRPSDACAVIAGIASPHAPPRVLAHGAPLPCAPGSCLLEIGSLTKALTGVLLATMLRRGETTLDEPVGDLLPADTRVPSWRGRAITIGHLATHTSGLPRLPGNLDPADPANPYADYTTAALHEWLAAHQLRRAPGARYEYSNLGAGLLGHALAWRAGVPFADLLRRRVLEPLGMHGTVIDIPPPMRACVLQGHDEQGRPVPMWDLPALAAAGALRSSVDDLLRLIEAVREPHRSPLAEALTLSTAPRVTVHRGLSVGLLWHVSTRGRETMVWHNGGTGGCAAMLGVNASRRTGMVIIGNCARAPDHLVEHALLGTPLSPWVRALRRVGWLAAWIGLALLVRLLLR